MMRMRRGRCHVLHNDESNLGWDDDAIMSLLSCSFVVSLRWPRLDKNTVHYFHLFHIQNIELNEYVTIPFSMNKDMYTYIHFLLIFWSISFATRWGCFGMFLIPFLRSLSSFLSHIFPPFCLPFSLEQNIWRT